MKKAYVLLASIAIVSAIIAYNAVLSGQLFASAPADICGEVTSVTLYAGQHTDAGVVTVANDEDNLYVTYETTDGWLLSETHLAVATSLDDIPRTKNGNPKVGNFPYKTEHDPAVNEFTYTLNLDELGYEAGTELYVATHAALIRVVDGEVVQSETGWGDGTRFVQKGNWAMYFNYTVQECDPPGPEGCTLTQGYWKTHSKYGPAPYNPTWATIGETTPFFTSGVSWFNALWVPHYGNAYYILAQQYIAATLNVNNGASTTPLVDATLAASTAWFEVNNSPVPAPSPNGQIAIGYSEVLDEYNNGLAEGGPPHCE
jgi:hypothetical protein